MCPGNRGGNRQPIPIYLNKLFGIKSFSGFFHESNDRTLIWTVVVHFLDPFGFKLRHCQHILKANNRFQPFGQKDCERLENCTAFIWEKLKDVNEVPLLL